MIKIKLMVHPATNHRMNIFAQHIETIQYINTITIFREYDGHEASFNIDGNNLNFPLKHLGDDVYCFSEEIFRTICSFKKIELIFETSVYSKMCFVLTDTRVVRIYASSTDETSILKIKTKLPLYPKISIQGDNIILDGNFENILKIVSVGCKYITPIVENSMIEPKFSYQSTVHQRTEYVDSVIHTKILPFGESQKSGYEFGNNNTLAPVSLGSNTMCSIQTAEILIAQPPRKSMIHHCWRIQILPTAEKSVICVPIGPSMELTLPYRICEFYLMRLCNGDSIDVNQLLTVYRVEKV